MTFQNYKLFSPQEMEQVRSRYPSKMQPLPSSLQVGQKAKLWVWDESNPYADPHPIACTVMRVEFGTLMPGCGVRYSVAFEIAGSGGWCAVVDEIRGNLTDESVVSFDRETDTLVEVTTDLTAHLNRSSFEAIPGGKREEDTPASETSSPRASLKLVPLNLPSLDLDAPSAT